MIADPRPPAPNRTIRRPYAIHPDVHPPARPGTHPAARRGRSGGGAPDGMRRIISARRPQKKSCPG